MSWPKNKDDWWSLVDAHWVNLFGLISRFLPVGKHVIINPNPEDRQVFVGDPNMILSERPLAAVITEAKENRDVILVRYLSATWEAAPDVPGLHGFAGWAVLCDLLSEEHVLYE